MDAVLKAEETEEIFVIRPSQDLKISRLEKNPAKIQAMYDLGTQDASASLNALWDYLNR